MTNPVSPRLRPALLSLLLATAAVGLAPAAQAAGSCPGSITALDWSPRGDAPLTPTVDATFRATGPGFSFSCDIGFVSTCVLAIDGTTVLPTLVPKEDREGVLYPVGNVLYPAQPCQGDSGTGYCSPSASCTVRMSVPFPLAPGHHTFQATVGVTWGCCGYLGGPEALTTLSWSADVGPEACPQGIDPGTASACGATLCPDGVVGTPAPGQLAVVCGTPVTDPCPTPVGNPGPGQLAVVCGTPVGDPCPQGVDLPTVAACGLGPVCPNGLTSPPGPAELAVICGVPVPAPVGLLPACMDGIDNDGDGRVDYAPAAASGTADPLQPGKAFGDAGCTNVFDGTE